MSQVLGSRDGLILGGFARIVERSFYGCPIFVVENNPDFRRDRSGELVELNRARAYFERRDAEAKT